MQAMNQPYDGSQAMLDERNKIQAAAAAAARGRQPFPPSAPPQPQPAPPSATPSMPRIEPIVADTPLHKMNLERYQHRDQAYQDSFNAQHKRHLLLAQEKKREIEMMHKDRQVRAHQGPMSVFGPGYQLGNAPTGLQSRVLYPRHRKRPRRSHEFRFRLDQLEEQGEKDDMLVPIRLEIELDGYKLRDTFTWNLNETLITPEQFAEVMCEDLRLPPSTFAPLITRAIQDQLQDYYLHAGSTDMGGDGADEEEEEDGEKEDSQLAKKRKNTELRMLMRLDITVGNRSLLDQFEWDIACERNDAEAFADKMTRELGLGGEFRTAIAHSIREQAHNYIKSLILVGYEFNGSAILDDDLRHSFLPSLKTITRDLEAVDRFTPAIMELTDAEIDKIERDRMREARRKRRQARGRRGIVLPDREPQKTCRTGVAFSIDHDMDNDTNARGSTPDSSMHSQRKSALRARMNIAAEAASNHHSPPVMAMAPQQGTISLSAGHRFPIMPGQQEYR